MAFFLGIVICRTLSFETNFANLTGQWTLCSVQDAGNINTDFCDASPMDAGTLWRVIFGPNIAFSRGCKTGERKCLKIKLDN